MKTKIFYGNQHIKSINVTGKKETGAFKRFCRKLFMLALLSASIYGAWYAGAQFNPRVVEAEKRIEVPVEISAPVLDRIAECESGKRHIDPKTGQVFIKVNSNGSTDIGYMQINSVNFALATKLGYDLTNEADNKAFGLYLYKNRGSEPWSASKACWNK